MAEKLPKSILDTVAQASRDGAIDSVIPILDMQAKVLYKKYVLMVKAGFTPEQALELCKGKLFADWTVNTGKRGE